MRRETWWYLSRASGLVAWALLGVACLWGILLVTRMLKPVDRPAWLLDLHRWLGALAVIATAVHVVTLLLNPRLGWGWRELTIPHIESWHHSPRAWGVFAMYALVLVQVTSMMMRRIPRRWWHGIHLLSYVLFTAATVHGVQAGPDNQNMLVIVVIVGSSAILLFACYVRLAFMRVKQHRRA